MRLCQLWSPMWFKMGIPLKCCNPHCLVQVRPDHLLCLPVPALQGYSSRSKLLQRQQGLKDALLLPFWLSLLTDASVSAIQCLHVTFDNTLVWRMALCVLIPLPVCVSRYQYKHSSFVDAVLYVPWREESRRDFSISCIEFAATMPEHVFH
jgi:hypothetical protein